VVTAMARVTIRELEKTFGNVTAVSDLNLVIEDGEFVTLLGPSGCGKSTTLGCVAGLEDPTSGEILFDDRVVTELSPRNRDIAMVFQDYALYPHMSVYDNMAFGLSLRKIPKSESDATVRQVADFLGLKALLDRRPGQLSGGQRQRVALGRAIVRNPAVFLMDEPLSNLDAALRVSTRSEIKRLQQELGTTTIFVTHDQEEAMVLSDRIAIMQAGRLQQYDRPKTIYNDPINLFVAGFIGSPRMNMIPGTLENREGSTHFQGSEPKIAWPAAGIRFPGGSSPEVTLGIRPEHVRLTRDDLNGMSGTVALVEPVGAVTYVDVRVGTMVLKASTDPADDFGDGEPVMVDFDARRVIFFETSSGERLRLA
jgi:multiple sugar transport system ATP-binding protein